MSIKAFYSDYSGLMARVQKNLNDSPETYGWCVLGPSKQGYWELRVSIQHSGKVTRVNGVVSRLLQELWSDNAIFKRLVGSRHDLRLHLRRTWDNLKQGKLRAEWLTEISVFLLPPE